MKFRTKVIGNNVHGGPVTCLSWNNNEEIYSISDDHQLYKWIVATQEHIATAKLPDDFFPTDLHCLNPFGQRSSGAAKHNAATAGSGISTGLAGGSAGGGGSGGSGNDALLITSSDGRFVILNKSSRVERNVTAHTGSISAGRWSPDGAGLLTAGEDGMLKVWSRTGMLRSTVVQHEGPIRCACWSARSDAIAYAQAGFVAIKPLAAKSKLTKWRAHDGLVLCLSWSNADDQYLATGGEDCRYKIWTSHGSILFVSYADDFPITSVDFSPKGDLLAVGGFNALRLCNYSGWTHETTKFSTPKVGSLFTINWSVDGTQVAMGTASGAIVFGYVIEQTACVRNLVATTTGRRAMRLMDIASKTTDVLDFPDRIVNWRLGYEHLVVATDSQVHIYHQKYINTPLAVIDGRNGVREIVLAKRHFLLLDNQGLWIYTYTGRLHLNPKYAGVQSQMAHLSASTISLGLFNLAIRDVADRSVIRVFELVPGASRQTDATVFKHTNAVDRVASSRAGHTDNQIVAFVDVNRELFCTNSLVNGTNVEVHKIGTQVTDCMWGSDTNILVGLHDSTYSIWYCAGECSADATMLALTTVNVDTTDFGKNVSLSSFEGATVTFGCNGIANPVQVNVFCDAIHRLVLDDRWEQALKVCRRCQITTVWATLAVLATRRNQMEICEEAFSSALQIDKVDYLKHIKITTQTPGTTCNAENAIMLDRRNEAEMILQHSTGDPAETIRMLLRLHNWQRALDVAQKHPRELARVLEQRRKYLDAMGKAEYDAQFLKHHTKTVSLGGVMDM